MKQQNTRLCNARSGLAFRWQGFPTLGTCRKCRSAVTVNLHGSRLDSLTSLSNLGMTILGISDQSSNPFRIHAHGCRTAREWLELCVHPTVPRQAFLGAFRPEPSSVEVDRTGTGLANGNRLATVVSVSRETAVRPTARSSRRRAANRSLIWAAPLRAWQAVNSAAEPPLLQFRPEVFSYVPACHARPERPTKSNFNRLAASEARETHARSCLNDRWEVNRERR